MVSYTSILCAIIILTTFLKFEIHSKKKFKKIAPLKELYNLCSSLQDFRKALSCATISKFPLPLTESEFWNSWAHTRWGRLHGLRSQAPLAPCLATWVAAAVGPPPSDLTNSLVQEKNLPQAQNPPAAQRTAGSEESLVAKQTRVLGTTSAVARKRPSEGKQHSRRHTALCKELKGSTLGKERPVKTPESCQLWGILGLTWEGKFRIEASQTRKTDELYMAENT